MNGIDLSILWPALAAGLLVTATHVPLGTQVLARGIVFIDLAIAQIAGCGVILADRLGFDAGGASAQIAALLAALAGAVLLTWTERRWPEVQEAIIGVVFVMAATAGVLLLAGNVHGSEHLRDLLVGQILWVAPHELMVAGFVYVAVLALWFGVGARLGRVGFYLLFAVVVTLSVQLVGVFLVFATLIVPPLAARRAQSGRLARAYAIGIAGYVVGIAVSAALDVPTGPLIVWTLVVLGVAHFVLSQASPVESRDVESSSVLSASSNTLRGKPHRPEREFG